MLPEGSQEKQESNKIPVARFAESLRHRLHGLKTEISHLLPKKNSLILAALVIGASSLALCIPENQAQAQQPVGENALPAPFLTRAEAPLNAAPRHLFGIAGHAWWMDTQLPTYLNLYRDLGTSEIRIAIDWKRFQPQENGDYDFAMYDRVLPAIAQAGIKLTGNFVTVPSWASSIPCEREQTLCNLPASREPQLRSAIRAAVSRYPFITKWEVGNEPEMWRHQGQNPADYLRFLRAFYEEATKVNPYIQVGAATLIGWDYVQRLYDLAPDKPWDAITFHPYTDGAGDGRSRPENMAADDPGTDLRTAEILRIRNGMVQRGDSNKPIWITEYGWERSPQEQAQRFQAMVSWMNTKPWITAAFLHMLHHAEDQTIDGRPQQQGYGLTSIRPQGQVTSQTVFIPNQPFYDSFRSFPRQTVVATR